jgi:glycosyltransferase involved in cell wall biosynthesis
MNIYAFHLLNDFSGSPKVLKQLITGWKKQNVNVTIVTCSGREGFLSNLEDVNYVPYWYRWNKNPFIRLFNLLLSQLLLILKLWSRVKKEDILYVNTVLPFGAALLGKLKGCNVIYHIHETSIKPALLKQFLFGVVKLCATDVVYVSKYLSQTEKITSGTSHVLYNAIETLFIEQANAFSKSRKKTRNVLMIASLKAYKGVYEFVELATQTPEYVFKLVVNASQSDIDLFFVNKVLPSNLTVYTTQKNTHPFYQWADVVLNLSRPDGWVETFGLTILEAMAYHLPVIVPPVGGITELVEDGINGFLVDCRDMHSLRLKLIEIMENDKLYSQMQTKAGVLVKQFDEAAFTAASLRILNYENPALCPISDHKLEQLNK